MANSSEAVKPVYLSPEQVCERLPGLTKANLATLRYEGKGPKFLKPTPRTVLYRESDITAWVESTERTSTSAQ